MSAPVAFGVSALLSLCCESFGSMFRSVTKGPPPVVGTITVCFSSGCYELFLLFSFACLSVNFCGRQLHLGPFLFLVLQEFFGFEFIQGFFSFCDC